MSNENDTQTTRIHGTLYLNDVNVNEKLNEISGSELVLPKITRQSGYEIKYVKRVKDVTYFKGKYYATLDVKNGNYWGEGGEASEDYTEDDIICNLISSDNGLTDWKPVIIEDILNDNPETSLGSINLSDIEVDSNYSSISKSEIEYGIQSVTSTDDYIIVYKNFIRNSTKYIGILCSSDAVNWSIHVLTNTVPNTEFTAFALCYTIYNKFVFIVDFRNIMQGESDEHSITERIADDQIIYSSINQNILTWTSTNNIPNFNFDVIINNYANNGLLYSCLCGGIFHISYTHSSTILFAYSYLTDDIYNGRYLYCLLNENGLPTTSLYTTNSDNLRHGIPEEDYDSIYSVSTREIWYDDISEKYIIAVNLDVDQITRFYSSEEPIISNGDLTWSWVAIANQSSPTNNPTFFIFQNGKAIIGEDNLEYDFHVYISSDFNNWTELTDESLGNNNNGIKLFYMLAGDNFYFGSSESYGATSGCGIITSYTLEPNDPQNTRDAFNTIYPIGSCYTTITGKTPSDMYNLDFTWKLIIEFKAGTELVQIYSRIT